MRLVGMKNTTNISLLTVVTILYCMSLAVGVIVLQQVRLKMQEHKIQSTVIMDNRAEMVLTGRVVVMGQMEVAIL